MTAGSMMGCVGSGYRIERTVGGTVRSGPFVPPYAYEHYVRGELALAQGDHPDLGPGAYWLVIILASKR